MASIYAREVLGIERPVVGLLNIGAEETKGNRLAQETYALLQAGASSSPVTSNPIACSRIARSTSSLRRLRRQRLLKAIEGGISAVTSLFKKSIIPNVIAKAGALLLRRAFSDVRQVLSYERHGGAPVYSASTAPSSSRTAARTPRPSPARSMSPRRESRPDSSSGSQPGCRDGRPMGARIVGTGSHLPSQVVPNVDLEKRVETSDEWIIQRTGIRTRHLLRDEEIPSDMGVLAARSRRWMPPASPHPTSTS